MLAFFKFLTLNLSTYFVLVSLVCTYKHPFPIDQEKTQIINEFRRIYLNE